MNRLAEEIVPFGFRIACRRASWPTRRSPVSVKATTEGVVRDPSALGITVGFPASVAAITELVVPKSIPTATAMATSWPFLAAAAGPTRGWGSPAPEPGRASRPAITSARYGASPRGFQPRAGGHIVRSASSSQVAGRPEEDHPV